MVAPLVPRLALDLKALIHDIGLIVPAYLIPYGIATIFYGVLSDRFGLRRIMFASLGWFVVLTALTATARSATELLWWRLLTGLGASGAARASAGRAPLSVRAARTSARLAFRGDGRRHVGNVLEGRPLI